MELPFQKRKRIRDPRAITEYKRRHPWCEGCLNARADDVHHVTSRARGGSDVPENFLALCRKCHRAWADVNKTRREWYEARAGVMSEEASAKVRRALRVDEWDNLRRYGVKGE